MESCHLFLVLPVYISLINQIFGHKYGVFECKRYGQSTLLSSVLFKNVTKYWANLNYANPKSHVKIFLHRFLILLKTLHQPGFPLS